MLERSRHTHGARWKQTHDVIREREELFGVNFHVFLESLLVLRTIQIIKINYYVALIDFCALLSFSFGSLLADLMNELIMTFLVCLIDIAIFDIFLSSSRFRFCFRPKFRRHRNNLFLRFSPFRTRTQNFISLIQISVQCNEPKNPRNECTVQYFRNANFSFINSIQTNCGTFSRCL